MVRSGMNVPMLWMMDVFSTRNFLENDVHKGPRRTRRETLNILNYTSTKVTLALKIKFGQNSAGSCQIRI